jgi:voltage-gated potassium channel Kch
MGAVALDDPLPFGREGFGQESAPASLSEPSEEHVPQANSSRRHAAAAGILGRVTGQILIGSALMIVTTLVHSGGTVVMYKMLSNARVDRWARRSRNGRIWLIAGLVVMMFLASLVEVAIWAATYLGLGALKGVERALYFSMVTFTTLGYGDIVLDEQWRLLGSFEAANGIIMFGWTTALIFAVVHRYGTYVHPDHEA